MEFNINNTFCISLASMPDRWSRMEERFKVFDMECERWTASMPCDVSDHFASYLNWGQKACGQSHVNIWRTVLERGLDYALIIEDDAMFHVNWVERLRELDLSSDSEWDAVFLNASEPIVPEHVWNVCSEQYLTGAYIISKRGIEWILSNFSNEYASSDWMTSRLQSRGHSYCYFPWLVIQEGFESTIGSGFEADHLKVVRCLGSRISEYR
jgi:GR25 family glycosyltransferase involved in LPS biosynthesis